MNEKRVRAALLAHRAAFDVLHTNFDIESDLVEGSLADLAYAGVMMTDQELPEAGAQPAAMAFAPHTDDCFNEQARAAWKERNEAVSNLNLRLAHARVAIALAGVVLDAIWKHKRGEGDEVGSSDLEALGAALDAFEALDERLPRVSI